CQLAGEVVARSLDVPLPGPVLGMLLLVTLLAARDKFAIMTRGPLNMGRVEATAHKLLSYLSLMFVPAAVGVVQNIDLIAKYGIGIIATLVVSVMVTLLATAATFMLVTRMSAPDKISS
uniref:CidA/LrgA family protein n=1 Tax=Tardiphaga sp. TaxID=1926292 RepID=UPI0037DA5736